MIKARRHSAGHRRFRKYLAAFLAVQLTGCAVLFGVPREEGASSGEITERSTYPQRSGTRRPMQTTVGVQRLDRVPKTQSGIEIIWEIPKEPVKGFVLNYGYSPDRLEFHLRLDAQNIQRVSHPQYGEVYRYVLESVPGDRSVFVSILSVIAGRAVDPSNVVEVKPSAHFHEDAAIAPQAAAIRGRRPVSPL